MYSQEHILNLLKELKAGIQLLFPEDEMEFILFGSYARKEASAGSDIDVMILVDASREEIAQKNWKIGELAANILLEYGSVISPIVENRDFFRKHLVVLPFFQTVEQEGVRIHA